MRLFCTIVELTKHMLFSVNILRSWVMAMVYNAVRAWLKENDIRYHEEALKPDSSWDVPRSATEALLPKMLNLIQQLKFRRPSARVAAASLARQPVHMSDFCTPHFTTILVTDSRQYLP